MDGDATILVILVYVFRVAKKQLSDGLLLLLGDIRMGDILAQVAFPPRVPPFTTFLK